MPARGDNNKKGSPGQGSSNKSNHAFHLHKKENKIMEIKPAEGLLKDHQKKEQSANRNHNEERK
jgi:hypothetical protein